MPRATGIAISNAITDTRIVVYSSRGMPNLSSPPEVTHWPW